MKSNRLTLSLFITALLFQSACASFEKVAYRTVGSIDIGVDIAMKTWAVHVNAGKATDEQQALVRTSYERYKAAGHVFDDAVVAYKTSKSDHPDQTPVQNAIDALVYASASLEERLKVFLPHDVAAKMSAEIAKKK